VALGQRQTPLAKVAAPTLSNKRLRLDYALNMNNISIVNMCQAQLRWVEGMWMRLLV